MYAVHDIQCDVLMSELVHRADFVFNVSNESWAKLFNISVWNISFVYVCDCGFKILCDCVYVSVVVYVEVF